MICCILVEASKECHTITGYLDVTQRVQCINSQVNWDVHELLSLLEFSGKPVEVDPCALQQLCIALTVSAQASQKLAELFNLAADLHRHALW